MNNSICSAHLYGHTAAKFNKLESLKQLNNTSTQVIHKNDTGLDQDGIYGWAATAKSLVSKERQKDTCKK